MNDQVMSFQEIVLLQVLLAEVAICVFAWTFAFKLGEEGKLEIRTGWISFISRVSLVPVIIATAIYGTFYGGFPTLLLGTIVAALIFVFTPIMAGGLFCLVVIAPQAAFQNLVTAVSICFERPKFKAKD